MILEVQAAQRLDSRGNPTVQVTVTTEHGTFKALVPSGASTGTHEAVELRDTDKPSYYNGKGVQQAVRNVNEIIGPALTEHVPSFDPKTDLKKIDLFMRDELDGTPRKSKLGANAILGVSMACARAGAAAQDCPLYEFLRREAEEDWPYVIPVPFFNVLNGGRHSGNEMAFQEFMVAPVRADSLEEGVRIGAEVYKALGKLIAERFGPQATMIGDEGGFAPPITHPEEALDLLVAAVARAGYTDKVKFGIDPASSEFYDKQAGVYDLGHWSKQGPIVKTPVQMMELYDRLVAKYPIILLEDPFAEDDWGTWAEFNKRNESQIELVGDDLICTNVERLKMAKEKDACNTMLLKLNQIGTVTETIEAAKYAKEIHFGVFVSHRSGETTDDFIADLTIGLAAGHLKAGAPARGERVAKYNRLLDIEAELSKSWKPCSYAGEKLRFPETCYL